MNYKLDKMHNKKLSVVIINSTLVEKFQNVYKLMHSGQKDLKTVPIKKYRLLV